MEPLAVVEHLDELEDGLTSLGPGGPGVTVDQLVLQGGEPAFTDRVVPALRRPREALSDVICLEQLGEMLRGVLPPQSLWKTSSAGAHHCPVSTVSSGCWHGSVYDHQRRVSLSAAIFAISESKSSPTYSK
jgi:hypothetical protein